MLNPFNDVNNIVRTMMRLIDYVRFSCAFDHENIYSYIFFVNKDANKIQHQMLRSFFFCFADSPHLIQQ